MIWTKGRTPFLIYTAGLIDADGSILLSKTEDKGRFAPALILTNCHLPTLEIVNEHLLSHKGRISKKKRLSPQHDQCYSLNVREAETLFKLLEELSPYLIQKYERSVSVLKYVETILENKGRKVTSELKNKRISIYKEWRSCHKLN